jgi:hypothetical protein
MTLGQHEERQSSQRPETEEDEEACPDAAL